MGATMALRWRPGPVFLWECLIYARRPQTYLARALFVAGLLVAFTFVWWTEEPESVGPGIRGQAEVGEHFFYGLVGTQLSLLLLIAPACTAGAVCLDKSRGTLTHLLVTDLSDAEIILGKLAARLTPVLGLVACGLPVLLLGTLLGGIDPEAVVGAFLIALGVAVLSATLALTLSVWAHQAYEVLLAGYGVWAVVLMALPVYAFFASWSGADWLKYSHPYWLAFAPYFRTDPVDLMDAVRFLAGCVGLSAVLAGVAVARVRGVAVRQAGRPARRRLFFASEEHMEDGALQDLKQLLPQPSLDNTPMLWREWHRTHGSRWARLLWGAYAVLAVLFSVLAVLMVFTGGRHDELAAFVNGFQVSIGMLLLCVGSVTALGEERDRGSLDVLLTTPLSTREIVWGKWWGSFRRVPRLAVLPTLVALAVALRNGSWFGVPVIACLVLAYGAALTSLGLVLATWEPRQGRAITWCVALYILVTAGWVFFLVATGGGDDLRAGLACASPFFGAGALTASMDSTGHRYVNFLGWNVLWIAVYGIAALVLLRTVFASFDHCLGRFTAARVRPFDRSPRSPLGRGARLG